MGFNDSKVSRSCKSSIFVVATASDRAQYSEPSGREYFCTSGCSLAGTWVLCGLIIALGCGILKTDFVIGVYINPSYVIGYAYRIAWESLSSLVLY